MYLISAAEGKILRQICCFKCLNFRVSIYLLCIQTLKSAGQCERKRMEVDCSSAGAVIWTATDHDACDLAGNTKT